MTEIRTGSPQSTFVTTVAWVFIVLGGYAIFIGIFQNIMIAVMLPPEAMRAAAKPQDVPVFANFMMAHPQVFFGAFLVVSVITFISGIGLLKRQNWARLIFIAVLVFGIVWNLGGLALMFFAFSSIPVVPGHAPAEFQRQFDTMGSAIMGFSVLIVLAFSGLFGWIIKRLISAEVKREFIY